MSTIDSISKEELLELSTSLLGELELFELLRDPRFVEEAECRSHTSLEASGLRAEISCAICCGIIRKCAVIKACLHRFCTECIEKAMRLVSRRCPKCRMCVPSRRSLVPDPLYDGLILRLIPDPDAFEEKRHAFLMAFNKRTLNCVTSKFTHQLRYTLLRDRLPDLNAIRLNWKVMSKQHPRADKSSCQPEGNGYFFKTAVHYKHHMHEMLL